MIDVSEKFLEFLESNPKASATVMEGNHTKSMIFDGALLVQKEPLLNMIESASMLYPAKNAAEAQEPAND